MKIRCTYSEEWRREFHLSPYARKERYGFIIGENKNRTCWNVLWDGVKSAKTYAKDFITLLNSGPNVQECDASKADSSNVAGKQTETI